MRTTFSCGQVDFVRPHNFYAFYILMPPFAGKSHVQTNQDLLTSNDHYICIYDKWPCMEEGD